MSRIAVFHPSGLFSAWSVSLGLADTFQRMGHDVLAGEIEIVSPEKAKRVKPFPSWEELQSADAIIVSGPEHLYRFLGQLYPDWGEFKKPKIGWMHETVRRVDFSGGKLDERNIRSLCDVVYTPAIQDEEFGFKYLPFGVDTEMFKPAEFGNGRMSDQFWMRNPEKKYDAIFIGLLYEKRQKFLQENKLDLKIGNVLVQDLDGVNLLKTNELYAQTLRESRVLVNLPSLCSHIVTKVSEALACGTAVVTPIITTGKEAENFALFENGTHLQYYEKNPKGLIDSLLNDTEYREAMARRGCEEVHKNHRLELRCATLLQGL